MDRPIVMQTLMLSSPYKEFNADNLIIECTGNPLQAGKTKLFIIKYMYNYILDGHMRRGEFRLEAPRDGFQLINPLSIQVIPGSLKHITNYLGTIN